MIIDPPSDFAPLEDWTAFRKEMEALAREFPENDDVREWLATAKVMEANLK